VWLVVCGLGGVLTLVGTVMLHRSLEAVGLVLLGATLALQAVGTWLRFGARSIFPVLVFASCALASIIRVSQVGGDVGLGIESAGPDS
jgi:hypothetical protein